ncbi:MAG: methionine adenosyltransferase [Candidatus Roizmanbacteria bacterium]
MATFHTSFTSESVCAGHPDKVCDQISDAIVDAVLEQDPHGRVAVETLVTIEKVVLAGEVNAQAKVNFEKIAREEIKRLGYTDQILNFTDKSSIDVLIHQQSPEIAVGVDQDGAGDQGMMFGYANDDTEEFFPLPITLAHRLAERIDTVREDKTLAYLRPDGKTQVTVQYDKKGKPIAISPLVIAVPHKEDISLEQVKRDLYTFVVTPVLSSYGFGIDEEDVIVNGTGVWHIGGPASDTGVTGRKIVVDTYGGYARVGGGAFSGKDPSKVDRSGAYVARYIAKNIVAHGLARQAEVRLAYVIGQSHPLMLDVETFGTEKKSKKVILSFINTLIDTSVKSIIETLDLRRPIYHKTASYGHFGRNGFPWEEVKEFIKL